MKYIVLSVTLLHFVNLVLSAVTVEPEDVPKHGYKIFDITKSLRLTCMVNVTQGEKVSVMWEKDGESVTKVESLKSKVTYTTIGTNFTITVPHAREDEAGSYMCVVNVGSTKVANATIRAAANIRVRTQDTVNVVEGEKLRIACTPYGNPPPILSWVVGNDSYTESTGPVILLPDMDRNISNAVFTMASINSTDRGIFKCIGTSPLDGDTVESETMVRIKDKYAALWPFLGICLEVFVLCAIILIYEKKRNKTELEESDTDQSPDQKNTPDHGKETNLRHRQ